MVETAASGCWPPASGSTASVVVHSLIVISKQLFTTTAFIVEATCHTMLGNAYKYLASVRDRSEHAVTRERSKADSPTASNLKLHIQKLQFQITSGGRPKKIN
jgi:hypothetical protein